jgi:hypothetical protein
MEKKNQWFTNQELRIIGISLAILSLGLAIAWFGFFWFSQQSPKESPTPATTSGRLN